MPKVLVKRVMEKQNFDRLHGLMVLQLAEMDWHILLDWFRLGYLQSWKVVGIFSSSGLCQDTYRFVYHGIDYRQDASCHSVLYVFGIYMQ